MLCKIDTHVVSMYHALAINHMVYACYRQSMPHPNPAHATGSQCHIPTLRICSARTRGNAAARRLGNTAVMTFGNGVTTQGERCHKIWKRCSQKTVQHCRHNVLQDMVPRNTSVRKLTREENKLEFGQEFELGIEQEVGPKSEQ